MGKQLVFIMALMFAGFLSRAQNTTIENAYDTVKTEKKPDPVAPLQGPQYDLRKISTVFSFNNLFVRDYMLGFGIGVQLNSNLMQARLNFDLRPYFEDITLKENDTLYNQYKEKDYYLNVSLQKRFAIVKTYPSIQPYVQFNAGLLWGNFKGWKKAPEQKLALAAGAGAYIAFTPVVGLQIGYQYFQSLLGNTPHRLCIQLQFNFCE
jgi:opacity protein-like surface antigen